MIILKPGCGLNPVTFTCTSCNFQYTASKIEYNVDTVIRIGNRTVLLLVKCSCPKCWHDNVEEVPVSEGGEE